MLLHKILHLDQPWGVMRLKNAKLNILVSIFLVAIIFLTFVKNMADRYVDTAQDETLFESITLNKKLALLVFEEAHIQELMREQDFNKLIVDKRGLSRQVPGLMAKILDQRTLVVKLTRDYYDSSDNFSPIHPQKVLGVGSVWLSKTLNILLIISLNEQKVILIWLMKLIQKILM